VNSLLEGLFLHEEHSLRQVLSRREGISLRDSAIKIKANPTTPELSISEELSMRESSNFVK
jgi:hypothetical protein